MFGNEACIMYFYYAISRATVLAILQSFFNLVVHPGLQVNPDMNSFGFHGRFPALSIYQEILEIPVGL